MKTFLSWFLPPKKTPRVLTERDLIRQESEIGSKIFGEVPSGRKRDFFCLDSRTWVWHESWIDSNNHERSQTTRYEINGDRVIKTVEGENPIIISGDELANLAEATRQYYYIVAQNIYHRSVA